MLNTSKDTSNSYIDSNNTTDNTNKNEVVESYNYKINYKKNNLDNIIEGTYYNGISIFTYNNSKYYYDSTNTYLIFDNYYTKASLEYDITKIFYIKEFLNNLIIQSTTTYLDNSKQITYLASTNDLMKYLFNDSNNYTTTNEIIVKENNDNIEKITIDLNNLNLELKVIEIEYSNINNITDLKFNMEDYTYKE
ncbi:MAG: hypothetical protein Q4E75_01495 [bacterium]|nr:hypothetical protein [bacterium]